jgi:hypothetical protein
VDHAVGDDGVGPAVVHGQRLGQSLAELDVFQAQFRGGRRRLVEHLRVMSTPMTCASGPTLLPGEEGVEACP